MAMAMPMDTMMSSSLMPLYDLPAEKKSRTHQINECNLYFGIFVVVGLFCLGMRTYRVVLACVGITP